ncbi:hypothetical protein ZWY2020_054402 [Hordeum vulgare]|nr:hypothetical protein ZWY2020_054402 [Hordeum vulgare]
MIFPPSFLDSSSWNDNQHAHHQQVITAASCGGGGAGDGGCNNHDLLQPSIMQQGALADGGDGGGQVVGPAKPMSMSERARLARVPLPEQGLKCPRCDSANTKFCYFNNYSLSQPRHFCRACRRYWTRGGALRNVPVGGGYRRHAKRAKPKQAAAAGAPAANGAASGGSTTTSSTTSACTTMSNPAPVLPAMLQNGGGGNLSGLLPPLLRLADFDAMSLGSTFSSMGKSSPVDSAAGYYLGGGGGGGAVAGLEQWRVQQMQGFPFFQAMADQQHTLAPAAAPAMAMPGMFHYLGLGNGGGDGRGGHEDDGGDQQFHHAMPLSKREGYPRSGSIAMYGGDHHLTAGGGYTSSYSNTATGNHLL